MTGFSRLDRRQLLTAAAVGLPALLVHGRAFAGAADLLRMGVASGEPLPEGFVIWTRLASDPLAEDGLGGLTGRLPVFWEVAEDERFNRIAQRGRTTAGPELAYAVHVDVRGLRPDRPYWYRFIVGGQPSEVGRAWTAPAPGSSPDRLRFTAASCSHYEFGWFSAYRHMAEEEESRFTLFLGDYIYENTVGTHYQDQVVRSYGMGEARTLSDYRRRYALHHLDPDMKRLHAAAACIAIWDDHEVQNDYSGIWSEDAATPPEAFVKRRTAGYRAFCENMPVRLADVMRPDGSFRLNRRMQWGRLARFDMVDGRQFRSRQPCAEGLARRNGRMVPASCAELEDPSRTFLGFEQERWLYDGWASSPAQWNILTQNLLIAPLTINSDRGPLLWTDTWNGFGAARQRLLDAMVQTGLSNPVTLAGDYHSTWCNNLRRDFARPSEPAVAAEFVVTSVTSNGPPDTGIRAALPDNPHIRFFDAQHRGYTSFCLSRTHLEARCMAIGNRADPKATVSVLHSSSVEAGRAGLA